MFIAPAAADAGADAGATSGRRVVAVHRQGGVDRVLGETTVSAAKSEPLALTVSVRGQDYALLVQEPGGAPTTVAVADGRTLDTVTTGGFLGLWFGVYGTSNGRPTSTVAHVERFEYVPRGVERARA
ncbi:hypothetical protein [Cellulomonas sp. ATA003]|uniref:beta-xylosidase family glycoside hydrolase n=1 Tax=Cellulomonas sp. ATA003 TaxID=3073064 RepID=UPI0028734E20|nr:hypothetical protein [Cellulomonas sp. ATA003]WNB86887.1 hypothetical protein REH70_06910 [Cellulomonas sp. ATA003]